MHIPKEHVVWQGIVEAAPEYAVPFGVHVFVLDTVEHLRSASEDPLAHAHSMTWEEPDSRNVGAIVLLSTADLAMSIVAHEATHIALYHHGREVQGRIGARRWLKDHPETVAEMVGNLTALIWYSLPNGLIE